MGIYPNTYRLQWLNNKGKLKVNEQVEVPFNIGGYRDKVACDVVPMDASHLLLGRPWQFDRKVTHVDYKNTYSFCKNGVNHILAPLSPQQVKQDQLAISKAKKESLFAIKGDLKYAISSSQEIYILVAKEVQVLKEGLAYELRELLEEFGDVFPEELPNELPPIRELSIKLI